MERSCTKKTGARPAEAMFAMVQDRLAAAQCAVLDRPSPARQAPAPGPGAVPAAAGSFQRTVLVVDGDDDYRDLVKHLLTVNHYNVLEAVTADEARSVINARLPDLVLVDPCVPKMNGGELLRELRGKADTRKVRVILFAGAADTGRLRALDLDISAFLEKPVSNAKLLESISAALGTARAAVQRQGLAPADAPAEVPVPRQRPVPVQNSGPVLCPEHSRAPVEAVRGHAGAQSAGVRRQGRAEGGRAELAGKEVAEKSRAPDIPARVEKIPGNATDDGIIAGEYSVVDKNERRAIARAIALLEEAEGRAAGTYAALSEVAAFKAPRRRQEAPLPAAQDLRSLPSSGSAWMPGKRAGTKLDRDESRQQSSDKSRRISREAAEAPKDAKDQRTTARASKEQLPPVPGKPAGTSAKMALLAAIIFLECMALGGLGYFFLGTGSFSGFPQLNFRRVKKTASAVSRPAEGAAAAAGQPAFSLPQARQQAAAEGPAPQGVRPGLQPAEPPVPAPEISANEKIRRALEIMKAYKLSGGRGPIESWFSNSFLSGRTGGSDDEWTATPLHGDIMVVQYRLLSPRQQAPLVYQFEVDTAKGDIVRGINNSAIELLDLPSRRSIASALPVKKPAAKPKAKRTAAAPKGAPMPPLSGATAVKHKAAPAWFERPENNEKVKYLRAQESDEDLF